MRKNKLKLTDEDDEKIQVHLVIPARLLDRIDTLAARFHLSRNTLCLYAFEKFLNAFDRCDATIQEK